MSDDCDADARTRIAILEGEVRLHVQHLSDRMDLKFDGVEGARKIQFDEFMRRLHELNGHHEELKQSQAVSVSRDLFDSKMDGIASSIRALENFQSNLMGRMAAIAAVAAAGGGGGALLVSWLIPG